MLPRAQRLSAKAIRGVVWSREKKTPLFSVRCAFFKEDAGKYAVFVPVRVSRSAPLRNRLRRMVLRTIRCAPSHHAASAVFILTPRALAVERVELEREVLRVMSELPKRNP